jgi:hypothetical protein
MPAVKQNRSKLVLTAFLAVSTPAATILGMLLSFIALPFLPESTPRAYSLKAGNADLAISTFTVRDTPPPLAGFTLWPYCV